MASDTPARIFDYDLAGMKFSITLSDTQTDGIVAEFRVEQGFADFQTLVFGARGGAGRARHPVRVQDIAWMDGTQGGHVLCEGECARHRLEGVQRLDEVAVLGVHAIRTSTARGELSALSVDRGAIDRPARLAAAPVPPARSEPTRALPVPRRPRKLIPAPQSPSPSQFDAARFYEGFVNSARPAGRS